MNKQPFDFECYGVRRINKLDYFINILTVLAVIGAVTVLLSEIFIVPNL